MKPGRPHKYPFPDLKIGQGFTVPKGEGMSLANMKVYAQGRARALGGDRRFSVKETPNGDLRVERVDPSTVRIAYPIN